MSDTCTVTINGAGQPVMAELPTREAKALGELAGLLGGAPRRPSELSAETIAQRSKRHEEALQGGRDVLSLFGALAKLEDHEITLVLQYVSLLHFGDKGLCSNENWILETINGLLEACMMDGIGGAHANGPGEALRDMAHSYWGFRASIDQAREAANVFKPLFSDSTADAAVRESIIALEQALAKKRTARESDGQTANRRTK